MIKEYVKFIKTLRKERGFSQSEIAKRIGIARSSYISVEQGKRELNLSEVDKLSDILSFSLEQIKFGTIPNYEKYKQMIFVFLRNIGSNDKKITKTKLAKLLYLADFGWFYENFKSMSGMQYRRIKYGPVADSYFGLIEELLEEGKINIDIKKTTEKEICLISESTSNLNQEIDALSKDEIKLIKNISKKWEGKNTNEIVNFTHNQLPYLICRDKELIPYELITQQDPDLVY